MVHAFVIEGDFGIAIEDGHMCGSVVDADADADADDDVVVGAYRQTFHLAAEGYHWIVVAVRR